MTEVPVAGTAASGWCACTCQYSAIWYGAYRRATDGSHSKLHRERRNILPVELTAYDIDGQAGLFVPNTAERTAMKEAAANIGGSFGTSISFARSASQQLVMDVTRGVLGGGSQYLATKMREVKVSVKANYQLLLISKKQ